MPTNYGDLNYGSGLFGGGSVVYTQHGVPVIVEVYETDGDYKGAFQSGVNGFYGCSFELNEDGCGACTLQFSKSVDLERTDVIKIKLFGSLDYFYTGVIRITPIDGSTEQNYNYQAFGLNDYLDRINAESQSYANKTIEFILDDLLDSIIVAKTPINKNPAKINPPDITLVSFDINYNQMPAVLDALLNIANSEGDYICGVDEDGDFFFLPRSTEIQVTLTAGKYGKYGIDRYEPHDSYEAKTKYFLLDKDGVYINTISSTEDNDIFEEKITAPDIDNTSALAWAQGILAQNETETRSASITWDIERWEPIVLKADGTIRIISNIPPPSTTAPDGNPYGSGTYGSGLYGGGQYEGKDLDDTLAIKRVTYIVNANEARRNIELGKLPVRMDEEVYKIRKNLTDLEVSLGL